MLHQPEDVACLCINLNHSSCQEGAAQPHLSVRSCPAKEDSSGLDLYISYPSIDKINYHEKKQLEGKTVYFGLQSQKDRAYCGQEDMAKVRESKEAQARNGLISFLIHT